MNGARKQKAMAVLVPLLAIALVFVLLRVFGSGPAKKAKARRPEPAKAAGYSSDGIDWHIPARYPATLRDPMLPATPADAEVDSETDEAAGGEPSELVVKGIVYSKQDPAAIVGTQIVREGDQVSGATVVSISRDSVEFEMDGKKWSQTVHLQTEPHSDAPNLKQNMQGPSDRSQDADSASVAESIH